MLHLIGVSEPVGCLGVILPMLTGVMPQLTPTAAAGLTVIMILATGFHIQRKDPASKTIVTLALTALCAFVSYDEATLGLRLNPALQPAVSSLSA